MLILACFPSHAINRFVLIKRFVWLALLPKENKKKKKKKKFENIKKIMKKKNKSHSTGINNTYESICPYRESHTVHTDF